MAPTVSVVIVAYQSGPHLTRCLQALAAQTFQDFETILVDNASTDGAVAAAVAACPRPVTVIDAGRNLGFAAGNNRGIAVATGRWIATLNPDAFAEHTWLAQLVAASTTYPDAVMFGSTQLDAEDPSRFDGVGDVWHGFGLAWRAGYGKPRAPLPAVYETFSPCAAAALWQRDALIAVGGFEEQFFCYTEDVELGFRLRLAGWRCLQVSDAIVHHVGSASTGKRSHFAIYHGMRNLTWTVAKCLPARLAWTVPLHLGLQLVQVLLAARRGMIGAALKGLWHGLCGVPSMLRQRPKAVPGAARAVAAAMTWRISALVERGPPPP